MRAERFVVDTNVLISASLFTDSIPGQAVQRALAQGQLVFSDPTFDELVSRLHRSKFDPYLDPIERDDFLLNLHAAAHWVSITGSLRVCRDPDDDKLLETAIAGDVGWLISGDRDLLILGACQGVEIATPADFVVRTDQTAEKTVADRPR